ncbi:MAG: aminopeptidase P family protein [Clostridia bacterium]
MLKKDRMFSYIPNVDAVVVTSHNNRLYFTEFSGSFGILVLTRESANYITDFRYFQMAKEAMAGKGIDVFLADNATAAYKCANELLHNINAKVVGYEDTEITVAESVNLFEKLPEYKFVPVGESILEARKTKTQIEIDNMTKAQQITDKAFTKILSFISSSVTEHEIAVELEYYMRKFGADGLAFETIIASGANGSKPHAHPTDKLIKNGDAITMDFGARYNGYCSDMTRTVFFGKPSAEMRNIYNVVLQAQQACLSNIKCGMMGKEIDALARQVIVSAGFANNFNHGLGHSVGIDIHERPTSNAVSTDILEDNMITTVEPGIYVADLGGVRIEDMVIVKKDKIINLTNSQKDIIIL